MLHVYLKTKLGYLKTKSGYLKTKSGYLKTKSGYLKTKSGYLKTKSYYVVRTKSRAFSVHVPGGAKVGRVRGSIGFFRR